MSISQAIFIAVTLILLGFAQLLSISGYETAEESKTLPIIQFYFISGLFYGCFVLVFGTIIGTNYAPLPVWFWPTTVYGGWLFGASFLANIIIAVAKDSARLLRKVFIGIAIAIYALGILLPYSGYRKNLVANERQDAIATKAQIIAAMARIPKTAYRINHKGKRILLRAFFKSCLLQQVSGGWVLRVSDLKFCSPHSLPISGKMLQAYDSQLKLLIYTRKAKESTGGTVRALSQGARHVGLRR